MNAALSGGKNVGVLMLVAAALAQYGAARLALHANARADGANAGRRAQGQWLPIAAVAIAAAFMNQPEVAVSVVLGTAVACLSLVAGLVTLMGPVEGLPATRRCWPFVLPAALIPFMAGFSGHLGGWHAVMMLVLGALILRVWLQRPEESDDASIAQTPVPAQLPAQQRWLFTAIALLLAGGGAYLAVAGVVDAANQPRPMPPGLIASIILSPLLLLPMIGTASAVAQHGYVGRALSSLVGTALLNLCLLLPLIILIYGRHHITLTGTATIERKYFIVEYPPFFVDELPLPYPMAAWRIDNVLLIVLGFAIFPIASGRWLIERYEAILLILGYTVYLVAEAYIAIR